MKKRRNLETWQAKLGTDQFNPLEVFELEEALKNKKPSVTLSGRKFELKYYRDDNRNMVRYYPKEGFTPMGFLDIDRFS